VSEERKHHPLGPSSLQNVESCPCFQGQQTVVHERAVAGTRAHNVTETGEDDARLSDEDAAAAAECMDFLQERREKMEVVVKQAASAAWKKQCDEAGIPGDPDAKMAFIDSYCPIEELTELNVRIDDLPNEVPVWNEAERKWTIEKVPCTTSGYFDRALLALSMDYAELFDWKFGHWPVTPANENVQGMSYAVGLFRKYPNLRHVCVWFKQPHLNYITSRVWGRGDVPEMELRVKTIVYQAIEARRRMMEGDHSKAKPNCPTCLFCAHIGRCEKVTEFACKVGHKFSPLDIPENITPTMALDPVNSSVGMKLAQVVKVWAEAFRRQTTDRVLRKDAPPPEGYKVMVKTGKREVIDHQKFREIALQKVSEEALLKATRYTLGDVEEAVNDAAPRGQKTAAVKEFKALLEEHRAVAKGEPYSFLTPVTETEEK